MPRHQFIYSEALLAQRFNMTRPEMKLWRDQHLNKDSDWRESPAGIALSTTGVKKLWRAMGNRPGTLDLSGCLISREKNGAAGEAIALGNRHVLVPMKMVVDKIYPNPYLLRGKKDGAYFDVRVASNLNCWVGMEFEAAPDPEVLGYYRWVGPPPPARRAIPEQFRGTLRST